MTMLLVTSSGQSDAGGAGSRSKQAEARDGKWGGGRKSISLLSSVCGLFVLMFVTLNTLELKTG